MYHHINSLKSFAIRPATPLLHLHCKGHSHIKLAHTVSCYRWQRKHARISQPSKDNPLAIQVPAAPAEISLSIAVVTTDNRGALAAVAVPLCAARYCHLQ